MDTQQVIGAALVLWAAWIAVRALRDTDPSRLRAVGALVSATAFILYVRLFVDFGAWDGWFLYVWFVGLALYVTGVCRVVWVWPDLRWRSSSPVLRRREAWETGGNAVLLTAVLCALVVPGLSL